MRAAITGGATGIGALTVQKLKAAGYHVTAFDINEPAEADVWIKTDMSDPASIAAAAEQAEGPFDCLISNAGLPPREGLEKVILSVNFLGLVAFTEAMLPKLAEGASVVNTASRAGAQWRENLDEVKALMALDSPDQLDRFIADRSIGHIRAYNLSKEAVIVWTMAQAERMTGMGLRMNSASPAAVSTGILEDFAAAFGEKMAKNVARAGRAGTPEEIADILTFLAGPGSSWLKGIDVCIDGGMSAMAMSDALGL